MWKWLTGQQPGAVAVRHALRFVAVALAATAADAGLLNDAVGQFVVRLLAVPFGS